MNFQFVKVEIVIFSVQNLTHLHLTYAEKNSEKNIRIEMYNELLFNLQRKDIRHNQKRLRQLCLKYAPCKRLYCKEAIPNLAASLCTCTTPLNGLTLTKVITQPQSEFRQQNLR